MDVQITLSDTISLQGQTRESLFVLLVSFELSNKFPAASIIIKFYISINQRRTTRWPGLRIYYIPLEDVLLVGMSSLLREKECFEVVIFTFPAPVGPCHAYFLHRPALPPPVNPASSPLSPLSIPTPPLSVP